MISGGQVLGFTAASLVMIVIPGPGVLFVVGRALAHGRRTALATACGHAAGNYVVAAFVAVGLGVILQRSATAFVAVKVIGAAYLVWLGIQAIRHRKSLADAFAAAAGPREGWRAARDGVVVGLTNPKSYILFGAEQHRDQRQQQHLPGHVTARAVHELRQHGAEQDVRLGVREPHDHPVAGGPPALAWSRRRGEGVGQRFTVPYRLNTQPHQVRRPDDLDRHERRGRTLQDHA